MESYGICPFVTGLFHWAKCPQGLEFPSFLRLSNISLQIFTTVCFSVHPLTGIWVASTFWLSWMMLLWMYVHICLFEYLFSIVFSMYLGVDLLGHMATLWSAFWGTAKLFSTAAVPFYIPTNNVRGLQFSCILTNTCFPSLWLKLSQKRCEEVSHCGFDLHFPTD